MSRLHYIQSKKGRQNILRAAHELGIGHFDTAPLYGDGLAEKELGTFLRGRRDKVTVATKVGLRPNVVADLMPILRLPIQITRALLRRFISLSSVVPEITADEVRRSVTNSLRRLRTDYIDILFLHEPSLTRIPDIEGLAIALDELRHKGYIRQYGVAGGAEQLDLILKSHSEICEVVQTEEAGWVEERFTPDITYGVLSAGAQSAFAPKLDTNLVKDKLRNALKRRRNGTVLVSSIRKEHLEMLAECERE